MLSTISYSLPKLSFAVIFASTVVRGKIGDVVCHYTTVSPSVVNYYTCFELASKYDITIESFLSLNPAVDPDCDTVQPDTEYCVRGFKDYAQSQDGTCGPMNGNTFCDGTEKQCCNGETWKCGDTAEDCAPGTCFSGACIGFPDEFSMDGKCGTKNGRLKCAGKWGSCCNFGGVCGTGDGFCNPGSCESGDCFSPPKPNSTQVLPWQTGDTPDGTCGGVNGYTCDVAFGNCCSKDGRCSSFPADCGTGCQPAFGMCQVKVTTSAPIPSATAVFRGISQDGRCGSSEEQQCKGSSFGDCCSLAGYCGTTPSHCAGGCQARFGTCSSTSNLSPDGTCGGTNKYECVGTSFGDCCSASGHCGSTSDHCGAQCQSTFGTCSTGPIISPDGSCGGANRYQCAGSGFGDCCGASGYCGNTTGHCSAGCQSGFGACTSGDKTSPDGTCGGLNAYVCTSSGFGNCCSVGGYCGSTVSHCAQGCQTSFSSECLTGTVPSVDGSCGVNNGGATCTGGPFNGNCCSGSGFCGTTTDHCGTGCQTGFGNCS